MAQIDGAGDQYSQMLEQMNASMQQAQAFQVKTADLSQQQQTFNGLLNAKSQAVKNINDLLKDSIQRGNYA